MKRQDYITRLIDARFQGGTEYSPAVGMVWVEMVVLDPPQQVAGTWRTALDDAINGTLSRRLVKNAS